MAQLAVARVGSLQLITIRLSKSQPLRTPHFLARPKNGKQGFKVRSFGK